MQKSRSLFTNLLALTAFLIFLTFTSPKDAFAGGPWTLSKGQVYTQIGITYIQADKLFNKTEPRIDLRRRVYDITLQAYAEYGVTSKLTVFGSFPMKFVHTSETINITDDFTDTLSAGSLNFPGNVSFGAKYNLINAKSLFTIQTTVEANTSDFNNFTGLQTGYNCWTVSPALAFGKSYEKYYFSGVIGFNLKTNQYSEEFTTDFEFGFRVSPKVDLIGVVQIKKSMNNGEYEDCCVRHTGLYVDKQEHFSYGLKSNWAFSRHFGLNAGVYGSLYGNQVALFPSLNMGFFATFN